MMDNMDTGLKVASVLILLLIAYATAVTFLPMPQTGNEHAKTIVPFLLGVLATLVGFYWGNKHEQNGSALSTADKAAITAAKEKAINVVDASKEIEDVKKV